MKIEVRYYTQTGNTKKLADAIADALGIEVKPVTAPLDEAVDILFLGSSVYAAGVHDSIKAFVADNKDKIGELVSFSTAALLSSSYSQITKLCEQNGVKLSQKEYHCRGSFKFMHKGKPDAEDIKAAAEFAKEVTAE